MQKSGEGFAGWSMSRGASYELRSLPRRGGLLKFFGMSPWVRALAGTSALGGALVLATITVAAAQAQHSCDAIGDEGWTVVATNETTDTKDGAPYRAGNDWFVDRTVTLLPLCNYFNSVGNYSLRSYSLDPVQKTERVALCRGGIAVAPYVGPCPPK
jgi:hypothetical protein